MLANLTDPGHRLQTSALLSHFTVVVIVSIVDTTEQRSKVKYSNCTVHSPTVLHRYYKIIAGTERCKNVKYEH